MPMGTGSDICRWVRGREVQPAESDDNRLTEGDTDDVLSDSSRSTTPTVQEALLSD